MRRGNARPFTPATRSLIGFTHAHATARDAILKIVQRGRREGTFRRDVTAGWQVTICLALIHGAAEEARTGAIESNTALELLFATIIDLLAGPNA